MSGQREPTKLVVLKGKKHFTKEELQRRLNQEITAPTNNIAPPDYLTKKQEQKFIDIACDLLDIGIMSNLDCDALARYIHSEEKYLKYDRLVNKTLKGVITMEQAAGKVILLEKLENLRDKALKQCRAAASDLGLTISSRCKLVVPKKPKHEDPNAGLFGDGGVETG